MQNILLPHVMTVRVIDLLPKLHLPLPAIGLPDSGGHCPGRNGVQTIGLAAFQLACSFRQMSVSDSHVPVVPVPCPSLPPRADFPKPAGCTWALSPLYLALK